MISDNVVIMTKEEFQERLAAEFQRGVQSATDDHDELVKRAGLKDYDSRIVYSTDGIARINVSSNVNESLGDCLAIQWMNEGGPRGEWLYAHFSPARARLIARKLILRATMLEKANGVKPIDPIPEAMRKGPIGI